MALVGSLVVSVTATTTPLQQGMQQAANSVKQMQQSVTQATGTISGLERAFMGLASQYIGLQALIGAVKSLVDAGRQMELIRITAGNVFGGTQEGGQAIEQMSALAQRLGVNFQDLVRGYTNVTAASRGSRVEGAETAKAFEQLISISRALGQSSEQTAGSILAFQQILTKGCHAPGTRIRMADGTAQVIEQIAVGDTLMGPDGAPRTVLLLAHGREMMYRVIPEQGHPFVVNEGHLLRLWHGTNPYPQTVWIMSYLQAPEPQHQEYTLVRAGERQGVPFVVEPVGEGEFYGVLLTGDHLYVDAQGFVHHNTVMAEEFRGQLGERLPGILQAGAKTMGVSLETLSKMMERGELGARFLINTFNTMFQDVGRKAEAAAGSFDAALARMDNAWTKLGESLTKGGFGIALKAVVDELAGMLSTLEAIIALLPGGKLPMTPAVAAMGRDVPEAPEKIPAVQALDAIGKRGNELMREFMKLKETAKTVVDPGDLANVNARLDEMRAEIIAVNEAYRQQETLVNAIVEQTIGAEVGKRINELAKQTAENQVKALQALLEQAEVKLNEFDAIRNDTRRRAELIPSGKEFFARDALASSKGLLDTITSLVAKIREAVSITPGITQPMKDMQREVEQRAAEIPKFRSDQQGIITSLEQIEDLYRQIGRVREENEKIRQGPEEAQVNAEARARKLQLELEETKKQFLLNPAVGTAMGQSALDFALADQQKLIGEASRTTISEMAVKQFDELHAKLLQQAEDLDRGVQSWAELRAAVENFGTVNNKILALDLERIRVRREFNQVTEDSANREQELSGIYAGLREEVDRLTMSEEDLLLQRLARARQAPFSAMGIPTTAETIPGMSTLLQGPPTAEDWAIIQRLRERQAGEFAQRKRELDLARVEETTNLLVSQQDEIRALSMTSEELLKYELRLKGATDGQRALAAANFQTIKTLQAAGEVAGFLTGFLTTDVFDLMKGQPESSRLASEQIKLDILKKDIATAESQLALAQRVTPGSTDQITKQIERLRALKFQYADLQESIRTETAKTEGVFEKFMTKLSQFLLKLFFETVEVNKVFTKLITQAIDLGLKLIGSAGAVSTGFSTSGVSSVAVAPTTTTGPIGGGGGVGMFQHGGPFWRGQPFIAGEAGPELILPTVPGVVLTAGQTQHALGGARMPTVIVNIATPDVQSFQQSRGQVSRVILNAISSAQRSL